MVFSLRFYEPALESVHSAYIPDADIRKLRRLHPMVVRNEDIHILVERSEKRPVGWEEHLQLNSNAGYVTGEEAKREFGLQVDLP